MPFMKRIRIVLMGCALLISGAVFAAGKDQYHVYKLGNGECVIDTRDHGKMKDQRGTDFCLGHFDYRMDAEKRRAELVKSGACKCPAGENC
jgi:hypothetical protein